MSKAPRAKDVAASLRLLGVPATHRRSPKGAWIVVVGEGLGFVLPCAEGKFQVALPGGQPQDVDGPGLMAWIATVLG